MSSRLKSEQPTFTMVVEPGSLVPADAYGEERLDTYRHGSLVEVSMRQEKSPKLLKKYWAILALAVRDCPTPWKTSEEANKAMKRAFGIVEKVHLANGREIEEVGSLTQLEGPDFELFFEGAMALLYRITGVDPDTLWKESPGPSIEAYESESPAPPLPSEEPGVEGGSSASPSPPATPLLSPTTVEPTPAITMVHTNIAGSVEADERAALATAEPMNTRELKQEAIQKVLILALDEAHTEPQRIEMLAENRKIWADKLPGHPEFIKTVFETAGKVMRKELPRPAAQKYLFGLKDG